LFDEGEVFADADMGESTPSKYSFRVDDPCLLTLPIEVGVRFDTDNFVKEVLAAVGLSIRFFSCFVIRATVALTLRSRT
jgi:hypothetical protein